MDSNRIKKASDLLETLLDRAAEDLESGAEIRAAEKKYMLELVKFIGVSAPSQNESARRFRDAAHENGFRLVNADEIDGLPDLDEDGEDAATGTGP